jgi:probable HAF family extracellular repeat protein
MKRVAVLACVAACLPVALGSASAKPRWVATQLGTLSFPGTYGIDSASVAVIAHGDVLGASGFLSFRATGATPLRRAFLWTSGRMIDLGTLGGSVTDGAAVNDAGTVVGSSTTRAGAMHAFLWRPAT